MLFQILGIWFRGLLSIAILAGGIYFLSRWYDESHVVESIQLPVVVADPLKEGVASDPDRRPTSVGLVPGRRIFRFDPGWNRPTGFLAAALLFARVGDSRTLDRTRHLPAHVKVWRESEPAFSPGSNQAGEQESPPS